MPNPLQNNADKFSKFNLLKKPTKLKYFIITQFWNNDNHKSMSYISNKSLEIENIWYMLLWKYLMLKFVYQSNK